MKNIIGQTEFYKPCVGEGIVPNETPCSITQFHKIVENVDTLPYNGIRNWRCPKCFDIHRQNIRNRKNNE